MGNCGKMMQKIIINKFCNLAVIANQCSFWEHTINCFCVYSISFWGIFVCGGISSYLAFNTPQGMISKIIFSNVCIEFVARAYFKRKYLRDRCKLFILWNSLANKYFKMCNNIWGRLGVSKKTEKLLQEILGWN